MCELFGVNYNRTRVINPLLSEFFSHGNRHPHGWGMAAFGNGVHIEKEAVNACDSTYLINLLQTTIATDVILAHIRLATRGIMNYANTHPFVLTDCNDRTWTLVHNGTISEEDVLEGYVKSQRGDTDSERLLMHIVACVNEAAAKRRRPMDAADRFAVVDQVIREVTPGNKVNLLMYDGEIMYVHTNLAGSLYQCVTNDGAVFSTRPLSGAAGAACWRPVPMRRLLAYRDGKLVMMGSAHKNEYYQDVDAERRQIREYLDMYSAPCAASV